MTWAALLLTLAVSPFLWLIWQLGLHYHPNASGTLQGPYLVTLALVALVVLVGLALRHGTQARRSLVWANLRELAALTVGVALATSLITTFVRAPQNLRLVFHGETFQVPTGYSPGVWHGTAGKDIALLICVCGSTDQPPFQAPYELKGCRNEVEARYGHETLLEDFAVNLALTDAGATHAEDVLTTPGRHKTGNEPGELVYRGTGDELRLWLDANQKVEVARLLLSGVPRRLHRDGPRERQDNRLPGSRHAGHRQQTGPAGCCKSMGGDV